MERPNGTRTLTGHTAAAPDAAKHVAATLTSATGPIPDGAAAPTK